MAARKPAPKVAKKLKSPPATTPESRENQMISLAIDAAEQQLREGTASAQVITHYLKLGSSREKLEQHKIALENKLLVEKAAALSDRKRVEELYITALDAMRSYSGQAPTQQRDEYED